MNALRTAFIGPVQTVEDYLNYTKSKDFALRPVADSTRAAARKTRRGPRFCTDFQRPAAVQLWINQLTLLQ